jgi:hypothetical protein
MNRLVLDVSDDFERALNDLVNDPKQVSGNKADVIRRAVATYKYLKDQEIKGNKIAITDQSGAVQQNVELP